MAKVNQVKLRQEADAAERAGRFDKAIEALRQVVQENPRDWNTINRIGDLYAKLNDLKGANEQYVKVARYFADDGFYLKAIALWKKVLRNDASLLEGHISLGDLYAKQGLAAEAKQTFALVYDEFVKRNKLRDAGEVLRRLAEVDPSDLKVRIRLAELYGREGDVEKAAGEFLAIAEELVKKGLLAEALQLLDKALHGGQRSPRLLAAAGRVHLVQKDFAGAIALLQEAARAAPTDREIVLRLAEACIGAKRTDDARAVLQQVLSRDANDQEARQQLGQVFLAEGRYDEAFEQVLPAVESLVEKRQIDRATALVQQIVQRSPSHLRSLAKLVELHRLGHNDALVAQTCSQLVEAYLAAGAMDQAASVLDTLVQLEPHNEQHKSKLKWLREQQEAPGSHFELDLAAAPAASTPARSAPPVRPASPARPAPSAPAAGIELSGPLLPEDQEFVSEHLAEGRVFKKYGLGDKARDQFEALLNRFPDNVDALRELADLHRERGEVEAAADRLRTLAQVFRLKGDTAKASRVAEEVDALAPAPGGAKRPAATSAPSSAASKGPVPAAARPSAPARAPAAAPQAARVPASPAAGAAASRAAAAPLDIGVDITVEEHEAEESGAVAPAEDLDYVDLEAVPKEPERPSIAFDLSDIAPNGEIAGRFIEEEAPPLGAPSSGSTFDLGEMAPAAPRPGRGRPAIVPAPSLAPLRPQPAPAVARAGGLPAELRRGLEEIESYVSMGFVEDAQGVLEEMKARFPGHPALLQRIAELGLEISPAGPGEAADSLADDLGLLESSAGPSGTEEPLQLGADFMDLGLAAGGAAAPSLAGLPETGGSAEAGFDLSAELGDLFGAQPAVAAEPASLARTDLGDQALSDIFREFQKGVDKQLGKEDYETRYNLGIAYKEMGLVDEAIAEFQLAAKDEKRLLECSSMLGICFLEKGMPKLAVKWFEKGLAVPGRSDQEYQGLRYDLASALEQGGEDKRALAIFSELYGQDASFRDVAQKMRRLQAAR